MSSGSGRNATLRLDAARARRLVLDLQGLTRTPRRAPDGAALLALIERLGFVQLDSIRTVERAHHMILFAREPRHRPALLRELHEDRAELFEHWAHGIAALLPVRFYPYWKLRFARERDAIEARYRRWQGEAHEAELDRVLARIRNEGPLMARDFAPEKGRPAGGWWDWHDGKTALELLWRTGRLAIKRREGFQKVYDLAERVIPEAVRRVEPSQDELVDFACSGALERLGVATPGEVARFFGLITIAEAAAWCAAAGPDRARTALLETADGRMQKVVARPDLADRLAALPEPPARLRVLNPFDPLLRDRARLLRLFGFDYRIEVFVPEARRRFGYYVFPLLEGERLIGRIDMRAERTSGDLAVQRLWLEPGVRFGKGRQARLEAELLRIARFAGLEAVRFADGHLRTRE